MITARALLVIACLAGQTMAQELHVKRAGRGPPIVLLPGSPGSTNDFEISPAGGASLFDILKRNFTVVAIDPPGQGKSVKALLRSAS